MQPYCQPTSKSPPFSPIPLTFDPFVLPQVVFGSFDRAPGAILERISPEHLTANVAFTSRSVTLRMILQCLYTCYCYCNFVSTESVSKAGLVRLVRVLTETFSECDYWTRSNISKRVIGGYTAFKGEFPYQVAVLHVTDGLICGGSIITKKWVLSAAHCFDRYKRSQMKFKIQAGDMSKHCGQEIAVACVVLHENYNCITQDNDIALLKLADQLAFNKEVKRIKLNKNNIHCVNSHILTWSSINDTDDCTHLSKLYMRTIPNSRCARHYSKQRAKFKITSRQLCATSRCTERKILCPVDSGSALVYNYKQIGVLSFPPEDYCICAPSVFTRVSAYIPWIDREMSPEAEMVNAIYDQTTTTKSVTTKVVDGAKAAITNCESFFHGKTTDKKATKCTTTRCVETTTVSQICKTKKSSSKNCQNDTVLL